MADPLSSIASVIGITATVIQLSKAFVELANDIRGGPEEIKSISRDVHAFCSIIFSLNATLKEEDIQKAINGDEAMAKMIQNLTGPLKNCQAVLGELMVKIQKLAVPRLEGTGFRMNSTSVKWGLFNKSELRDLQLRLEAAKSTLGRALEAVTTYITLPTPYRGYNTNHVKTLWRALVGCRQSCCCAISDMFQ